MPPSASAGGGVRASRAMQGVKVAQKDGADCGVQAKVNVSSTLAVLATHFEMFQFCRYPNPAATVPERHYFDGMTRLVDAYQRDGNMLAMYHAMLALANAVPQVLNGWLALLRLELWLAGGCSVEVLAACRACLAAHLDVPLASLFQQEECLALFDFCGLDAPTTALAHARAAAVARRSGPLGSAAPFNGPLVYRPHPSGFFSVIENISLAAHIAALRGQQLLIDLDGGWWRYPIPFQAIFRTGFSYCQQYPAQRLSEQHIDIRTLRAFFFSNQGSLVAGYTRAKAEFYRQVAQQVRAFCAGATRDTAGGACVFVRRGDKLMTEAIEIPAVSHLRQLSELAARHGSVALLSDDARWSATMAERAGQPGIRDATPKGGTGYVFLQGASEAGTIAIMQNYLALVDADAAYGDASCNLVNAASLSRVGLAKPALQACALWPAPAYTLL